MQKSQSKQAENLWYKSWFIERSNEDLLLSCGHMNVNVLTAGGFGDSDSNDTTGGRND